MNIKFFLFNLIFSIYQIWYQIPVSVSPSYIKYLNMRPSLIELIDIAGNPIAHF